MFNDVVHWLLARTSDRRQYKRRAGEFQIQWLPEPSDPANVRPGIATDVSPSGIVFIIPDIVSAFELNLVLLVRDRSIPVRVKRVRSDRVDREGRSWNRYMCEFVEIAADGWDSIVRYVNETEPQRRRLQNQAMSPHVDDAYLLLPTALRTQIIDLLVDEHKLDRPSEGVKPMLKLFYGGLVNDLNGRPMHRFNVHSRVLKDDRMMAYDTRLLIADDGRIALGATPEP